MRARHRDVGGATGLLAVLEAESVAEEAPAEEAAEEAADEASAEEKPEA